MVQEQIAVPRADDLAWPNVRDWTPAPNAYRTGPSTPTWWPSCHLTADAVLLPRNGRNDDLNRRSRNAKRGNADQRSIFPLQSALIRVGYGPSSASRNHERPRILLGHSTDEPHFQLTLERSLKLAARKGA